MNSTKAEKINENTKGLGNYNEEDDNYYYNSAFKVNTKTDAGSTRPKGRIPVWKLKLENETEIPQMPADILERPNDKHYEKELAQLDQQIAHHNKSIEETKAKIKAERFGNSPEIKKLNEDKGPLKEKRDQLDKQIQELEDKVKEPKRKLNELRSEKDAIAKEIDVNKIELLNAEIKSIQQKLGFSSLSVSEEKKLIERKSKLESQKPKVQRFAELSNQIKELNNSNSEVFNKLRQLYEEKKPVAEKLKHTYDRLNFLYKNVKDNDPNIQNLMLIENNIYDEIKKCQQKKRDINKEWNDKWYHYEEQQKLIKYVKEATEAITKLKKKEEKERKRREKAAKKENTEADVEIVSQPTDVKLYEYEIGMCKWLIGYFKNLSGIKDNTAENTQAQVNQPKVVSTKLEDDIKKGLIKEIKRDTVEDSFVIGMTASTTQNKKKTKGPKISKREQKLEKSNNVNLDIEVIRKIKDVGLTPPSFKSELPEFLSSLEKVKGELERKSNPNNNVTANKEEEIKNVSETVTESSPQEHTETHVETVVQNEDEVTTITVTTTIITTTEAKNADEEGVVEEVVEEIVEETTES